MGTSSKCSPRCSVGGMLQLSVKLQSTSRHHFMNLGALLMQGLGLTQNSMPCKWTWVRAEGSWGSITPPSPLLAQQLAPSTAVWYKAWIYWSRAGCWVPSFPASPPSPGTASFTLHPLLSVPQRHSLGHQHKAAARGLLRHVCAGRADGPAESHGSSFICSFA